MERWCVLDCRLFCSLDVIESFVGVLCLVDSDGGFEMNRKVFKNSDDGMGVMI